MADASDQPATKADISLLKTDITVIKADLTAVKTDLTAVKTDLTAVKTDLGAVKTELTAVKTDLGTVKADLTAVKTDLAAVKTDLAAVKTDLTTVKADIIRLDQKSGRMAVALVNTQADVRRIEQSMATKKDVERILGAIDAFAKKSENNDKAVALHGHVLTEVQVGLKDHEGRLKILESGPGISARRPKP